MVKNFILFSLIIFSFLPGVSAEPSISATKVILVRHAEKAKGKNPELLPPGKKRALALAQISKSFDIAAIYSTPLNRTKQTAEPLAKSANLTVNLSIKPMDYAGQLAHIKKNYLGKTVVIVGHGNTVPEFINHVIPKSKLPFIDETDFSQLFIITLPKSRPAKLNRHTYKALKNGNISVTPTL